MFSFDPIIIAILLLILIPSIACIILSIKISRLETRIYEESSFTLRMFTRMERLCEINDELMQLVTKEVGDVSSLSQGVQYLFKEQKKMSEQKIYPTPQLSEMIGITIKEQIATEEVLSNNMRIPNSTSTMKIIENVVKTYPHVDEEYLTKRCLAQIESHVQNVAHGLEEQG